MCFMASAFFLWHLQITSLGLHGTTPDRRDGELCPGILKDF